MHIVTPGDISGCFLTLIAKVYGVADIVPTLSNVCFWHKADIDALMAFIDKLNIQGKGRLYLAE